MKSRFIIEATVTQSLRHGKDGYLITNNHGISKWLPKHDFELLFDNIAETERIRRNA